MLKGQDIVVLVKLQAHPVSWTYAALAESLLLSPSAVHSAVQRLRVVQLVDQQQFLVHTARLLELLIHGLKYFFPPKRGSLVVGIPTAHAAEPLATHLFTGTEPPPVWPYLAGTVKGESFAPLHKVVPRAVLGDPELQELLTLIDAVRGGRARERTLATQMLKSKLGM